MVFDDTMPTFENARFKSFDWTDHYSDAVEAIPRNDPGERANQFL